MAQLPRLTARGPSLPLQLVTMLTMMITTSLAVFRDQDYLHTSAPSVSGQSFMLSLSQHTNNVKNAEKEKKRLKRDKNVRHLSA